MPGPNYSVSSNYIDDLRVPRGSRFYYLSNTRNQRSNNQGLTNRDRNGASNNRYNRISQIADGNNNNNVYVLMEQDEQQINETLGMSNNDSNNCAEYM